MVASSAYAKGQYIHLSRQLSLPCPRKSSLPPAPGSHLQACITSKATAAAVQWLDRVKYQPGRSLFDMAFNLCTPAATSSGV